MRQVCWRKVNLFRGSVGGTNIALLLLCPHGIVPINHCSAQVQSYLPPSRRRPASAELWPRLSAGISPNVSHARRMRPESCSPDPSLLQCPFPHELPSPLPPATPPSKWPCQQTPQLPATNHSGAQKKCRPDLRAAGRRVTLQAKLRKTPEGPADCLRKHPSG